MIYDYENAFFESQDLSKGTASPVIANGEGGDAYRPLWLSAHVEKELSADATLTLTTSDKENMAGAVTLTTLTLPKGVRSKVACSLPQGAKKFLKLNVSEATTGTLTAALVLDTDV